VDGGFLSFLIRWDRAGAIVTSHFDFVAYPHILADSLAQYSRADRRVKGYDKAMDYASSEENRDSKRLEKVLVSVGAGPLINSPP
jgi:hypothetical protein